LELRIREYCQNFTKKGLGILGHQLKHLRSLQTLKMKILKITQGKSDCFALASLGEAFQSLQNLRHLELNFDGDELITYQELVALGRGLKTLPFLKDFTLKIKGLNPNGNLWNDENINQGFQVLGQTLQYLSSLQKLHLLFESCSLTDHRMKDLSQGITNLPFLTDFTLLCYYHESPLEIRDQGISYLSRCLECINKSLQRLEISFIANIGVREKGFEGLCKSIKTLVCLKSLYITFPRVFMARKSQEYTRGIRIKNDIYEPTEQSTLENLADALKSLVLLQEFTLYFIGRIDNHTICGRLNKSKYWRDISDNDLRVLCQELKGLQSLKMASINLKDAEISEKGLKYLVDELKSSNSLQRLFINFPRSVSEKEWNYLDSNLEAFKALEYFEFNGYNNYKNYKQDKKNFS